MALLPDLFVAGIDPISASIIAVSMLGSSVYQGQQQKSAQKKGLRAQEAAQQEQLAMQARAASETQQAQRAADRQQASVNMDLAKEAGRMGPASTMLTGTMGEKKQPKLGQNTLLGY